MSLERQTNAGPDLSQRLGDFQFSPRVLMLMAMALVVGLLGLASSWALLKLIALTTNLAWYGQWSFTSQRIADAHVGWAGLFIPAAGGLVIGLMARYGSEKIRGHGIPEAIEAILIGGSRIQPKVALLKPLSSAISIGTGGPFGAEGPIIMTGGALGSLFAQLFQLTAAERKTLLVAGAAAGMTGVFGTPVAAILLAVELLLFEWRPRSFLPVAVAAIVAAALRPALFPSGPLFPFMADVTVNLPDAGMWFVIGVLGGIGSTILTTVVYGTEDLFAKLPVHWMWWPAIGGLIVGAGGLIEPSALGVGYDVIGELLKNSFTMQALLVLLVTKALMWSIALGSGTSGGVLAPLLIIGGALGALVGTVISPAHAALFALLGMASMMGGTMRSPLTATIFALELTGSPDVLLPLITACTAAHAVTILILDRSILTERIARRGHHIFREYGIDPFETTRVGDIMIRAVDTLPAELTVDEVVKYFTERDDRHKAYPVIDGNRQLVGIVSRGDVLRWMVDEETWPTPLADAVTERDFVVGSADEMVGHLADRMARADVGRVPIVDADGRLIGLVARKDLLDARAGLRSQESDRTAPLRRRPRPAQAGDSR
ncbi:MAG: CBS domain-containing protein [Gammaproteobacteria bacterium PRO9]|nr:CBS domain-containing protein [Gammaproteobacteria bacterium PRO9]